MAQAVVAQHIAASLPAGTVLASRYRLEELIAESGPTVTWRAFDQVLSRSVLVHLLAPAGTSAGSGIRPARGVRAAGRGPTSLGGHRLPLRPGAGRGAEHRSRPRLLHRLRVRHRAVAGDDPQPRAAVRAGGGLGGPRGRRRAGRRAQPRALPPADQSGHGDHHPDRQRQDRRPADRGGAATGRRDARARGRHPRAGRRDRPGPAALRLPGVPLARADPPSACPTHRCSAATGGRRARSGPGSPRPWTTSATRSSATRPGTGPTRSPPRTAWSTR